MPADTISTTAFADLMAELPAGVAVITTHGPAGPMGLVVTSLCAYTADPPSVLASVAHGSRCHPLLLAGEAFGVHLLDRDQQDVAHAFAGRSDDKFAGLDWSWDGAVPRVHGTVAYMRCRREAEFSHRDHTVVIGRIEHVEHDDAREAMVYLRRRFGWRLS